MQLPLGTCCCTHSPQADLRIGQVHGLVPALTCRLSRAGAAGGALVHGSMGKGRGGWVRARRMEWVLKAPEAQGRQEEGEEHCVLLPKRGSSELQVQAPPYPPSSSSSCSTARSRWFLLNVRGGGIV